MKPGRKSASQRAKAVSNGEPKKHRWRGSSSGYSGVYPIKGTTKWSAQLTVNGTKHYLGSFDSPSVAYSAKLRTLEQLYQPPVPIDEQKLRDELLDRVRKLYADNGIAALSTTFLEKQRHALYPRLRRLGINQSTLLRELNLTGEYQTWRDSARAYRGDIKPKWSWEQAIERSKQIVEKRGDLPSVAWFRKNGLSALTTIVHKSGHTWEDLRAEVGLKVSAHFVASRNGMRWRSHPEASLSNFLHARGIEHKVGERYPASFAIRFKRRSAQYDCHFLTKSGRWISVEIWGDLNNISNGRYDRNRKMKELFHKKRDDFLGIHYLDCQSDNRLTEILEPYLGTVEPFNFSKPTDTVIQTAHWSDAENLLEDCKKLAATMPDGIFPSESWLRKRGKYADRPGPSYNTMAVYIQRWLDGTRKVRSLLDQSHASTTSWTREGAVAAWRQFELDHGVTPSQCNSKRRRREIPEDVAREGHKIYTAVRLSNALDEARRGKTARKTIWTAAFTENAWNTFVTKHQKLPSEFMSRSSRKTMPKSLTTEATRIYSAARYTGLLKKLRLNSKRILSQ